MINTIVAKALVFRPDGLCLALKRSNSDTIHAGEWDLPGGGVEVGEEFMAAVIRETYEETQLKLLNPVMLFAQTDIGEMNNLTRLCFLGGVNDFNVKLSEEHIEFRWLKLEEFIRIFHHPVYSVFLKLVHEHQLTPVVK